MAIIVQDSFNRADSTTTLGNAETGQTWQRFGTNAWGIINNQAYMTSGTNGIAFIDVGVSDCIVSVKNPLGLTYANLALRVTDANNQISIQNDGTKYYIYKRVSGAFTLLGSANHTTTANDIVKVRLEGTTIELYINGVSKLTVTSDVFLTNTKHGISPADNTRRFDDFLVESLTTDTGTDGSTTFDLKQVIYSDASLTADTKQSLYADSSTQHDLRQSLYEILSTVIDTKQIIYEDSATAYDMLQEIFNDGQIGSTPFDMRIQLYADESTVFDSKQSWYEDGLSRFDVEQAIYEVGQSNQDMKLVIYADASTKADTLQQIYSDSFTAFDTKQTMFNADTQLIGTVQLKGSRKLYVYLKGSRNIGINLKGRVGMTEINQNFSMYAGDSHIIKIPITSDVPLESGATVKWAIKKRNATVDSLLKTTSGGITVENGEIHIKLVPEDTATLAGDYRHECELTDNAGNVSTVFEGLVTVKKSGV